MAQIRNIKLSWIATALFGLGFLFLLSIRLDFFQEKASFTPPDKPITAEKETWMNIFQKERKIGYSYRRITPLENGYSFFESANMLINTMGMAQDIHLQTTGILHSDFSLDSFDFELKSSLFHFKVRGKKEGNTLIIHMGKEKVAIPVNNDLYLTSGAMDALLDSNLELNKTKTFYLFDPATMGERPVRVTMVGKEILDVMGGKENTRKFSIDFMGTTQTVWIDEEGSIVQEDGFMGIRLQRTTKKEALGGHPLTPSTDLTEMVSVSSNIPIKQPDRLSLLRLKISGATGNIFLNGGRQTLKDDVLTIEKENLPDRFELPITDNDKYLGPSLFIQADHPKILQCVSEIVDPDDTPLTKAQKLMTWVYDNIEKRPVLSIPNALETLENRMGDCNEHAVLMAALARAAGIPAQIEAGLVYMRGRFYYHAWNVLYLGKWITVDALMGQMPADVTHIRIVRGEQEQQIDLVGVIGKINLIILEQTK